MGKYAPAHFRSDDAPNLFTSPSWREVMTRTYGFDFHEVAGLHFALIEDALGARMVAPAFGDYARRFVRDEPGDGPSQGQTNALEERIAAARAAFPHASFTIKCAGDAGLPDAQQVRASFLHELDPSKGLAGAKPAFRRNVAKAKRAGLAARLTTEGEALRRFYDLYARQRLSKFASLPQPRRFVEAIADIFFAAGDGFLVEIYHEDRSLAFALALRHEGVLYYKFGASDPESLHLRPNNLAMAALIDHAVETGMTRLDLGLTPSEGGLSSFKRAMGAREWPLGTYRWPPLDGREDIAGEKRALLSEVTASLVANDPDPDEASRYGEALYRYFV
ncbi:GNAT family N-acetyltransferase [Erythrobacter sp.]|jgi:hypothetical protein|uniref:GNAT family N-acetyltransferase n=1 Tax=Erythrobacter sp. TaxID=1042 RepID=UPI002E99C442|nr:GNAT family N-acetyltransferase [Erythrobacter sp.]